MSQVFFDIPSLNCLFIPIYIYIYIPIVRSFVPVFHSRNIVIVLIDINHKLWILGEREPNHFFLGREKSVLNA